jgi:acetyl-CoA synthetase
VRPALTAAALEGLGLPPAAAEALARRIQGILKGHARRTDPEEQVRLWLEFRGLLMGDPRWRSNFEIHRELHGVAFDGRDPEHGPAPAWVPGPQELRDSNLGRLIAERRLASYDELHRWSVEHRQEFWEWTLRKLGIVLRREPSRVLGAASTPEKPAWLPGATMNIAESCFRGDARRTAILFATEGSPEIRKVTLGELRRLANRVANGLDAARVPRGARLALFMPMTPESVAIYLGAILSGRAVVGIADASAPEEFAKRAGIAGVDLAFTIDSYVRGGKEHRIYDKVVAADGPRAIVLPAPDGTTRISRPKDTAWDQFLPENAEHEFVVGKPGDPTNILFSSGTTKDPKAIPWTHLTPIKSAADGYLHHDVHPSDVLAWPTSFGWMMGPWLTYASLVNGAAMALFVGDPARREFGEFVARAGVTILGVVPKLVRSWMAGRTMDGLDWSRVRLFSSTAEPSSPEEMLYLMFLAGYKPIIEYCGGTEIGGAYLTGTVVQPCAPGTFTTPALGLDLVILDEGAPSDRGEVFLVPPSIGLSTRLLNYDHSKEYFTGVPRGPHGEVLRRHGDRLERLHGGFYRHLGRIDDVINIGGVKTSAEEIRSVLSHDLVYDSKPAAVDIDGSGRHALVVYVVPRDPRQLGSADLRERLVKDFQRAIRERLNPLLAHVEDVVLVPELPQAGPGKTRTMKELERDYLAYRAARKVQESR